MDIGGVYIFQLFTPFLRKWKWQNSIYFLFMGKENIFEDSMAPDFWLHVVCHILTEAQVTLKDMERKKRQHFLAKLLMPSGSWLGTFWSFASKTKNRSFSLAVTES